MRIDQELGDRVIAVAVAIVALARAGASPRPPLPRRLDLHVPTAEGWQADRQLFARAGPTPAADPPSPPSTTGSGTPKARSSPSPGRHRLAGGHMSNGRLGPRPRRPHVRGLARGRRRRRGPARATSSCASTRSGPAGSRRSRPTAGSAAPSCPTRSASPTRRARSRSPASAATPSRSTGRRRRAPACGSDLCTDAETDLRGGIDGRRAGRRRAARGNLLRARGRRQRLAGALARPRPHR